MKTKKCGHFKKRFLEWPHFCYSQATSGYKKNLIHRVWGFAFRGGLFHAFPPSFFSQLGVDLENLPDAWGRNIKACFVSGFGESNNRFFHEWLSRSNLPVGGVDHFPCPTEQWGLLFFCGSTHREYFRIVKFRAAYILARLAASGVLPQTGW